MKDTLYVNGCTWPTGNRVHSDPKFIEIHKENKLL
jgi:hypothetical protein